MMLEGLHPKNPTHVMRLTTDGQTARRVADIVSETFEPAETAAAAFEEPDEVTWVVEVFFRNQPDESAIRELVAVAAGEAAARGLVFAALAETDWVKASLDGLKPVRAGRFAVHGSHDRGEVRANEIGIEIEAALAFGTGHHGTTLGCLETIDRLTRTRAFPKVLDVGTGTGVLAIAAGLAQKKKAFASDIDPVSVEAARANARLNGAAPLVEIALAAGLKRAVFADHGPYDLIVANILPRPLCAMASDLVALLAPNGVVVLSGIIRPHAGLVVAAYRARGLRLVKRRIIGDWVTLTLAR